jgi:hypothetical protein
LSAFDTRHNFVWSGTYDLPWRFRISSIVTFHSGFPVTIFQNPGPASSSLQDSRGGDRPDRVPGRSGKVSNPTTDRWLDISAYTPHGLGVFGNAGNSSERAPGFANWDFAIGKEFSLSENRYAEFRAEFFNFTNHPSLAPPQNNISDPNNFGKIFGTVSPPRNIEFALKIHY